MNSTPFISVCIPAYKRQALLKRALDSLAAQTFRDIEVILTDDTPDGSVEELLQQYSALPLHYTRNIPAAGMPANWNRAMQQARGQWIQLLHADDWYASPDALGKMAAACAESNASFIFCASREINAAGEKIKEQHPTTAQLQALEEDPFCLVQDNLVGHPSVLLHRRDEQIQYDTTYKWVVDIDFYIRYLQQHPVVHFIPEPLIHIGMDDEQVSASAYKNPAIEIPEYLQLISGLPAQAQMSNRYVFMAIWTLVKKFRIREEAAIRKAGYRGTIPAALYFIIRYQQRIPRLVLKQTNWSAILVRRCYRKWMRQLQP